MQGVRTVWVYMRVENVNSSVHEEVARVELALCAPKQAHSMN